MGARAGQRWESRVVALRPPEVELEAEEYGASARLRLAVQEERLEALCEALAGLGVESSKPMK